MFTVDRETGIARVARTPEGSFLVQETGQELPGITVETTIECFAPMMAKRYDDRPDSYELLMYRIDGSYIVAQDYAVGYAYGTLYQTWTEARRAWEMGQHRVYSLLSVDKRAEWLDDLTIY